MDSVGLLARKGSGGGDQRQTSPRSPSQLTPVDCKPTPSQSRSNLSGYTHVPDGGQSKLKNLHGVRGASFGFLR